MSELKGRIALVTGSSRGIGQATARALAAAGARVIATDLEAPVGLASDIGGWARKLDVTREDDWVNAMAFANRFAGGLDILVNNAGVLIFRKLVEMSLDDWRRIQAVNVEGTFLGCKYAIPLLSDRASQWIGGTSIINMSSIAGLRGNPDFTAYTASKGAIRLLSKSLAKELAERKIRVNSVHPGLIDTDMGRETASHFAERHKFTPSSDEDDIARPLVGAGSPTSIADAVTFLASDKAAFMTGSEVVIDGGLTA
ncbi:SDR family oxidoreductase [Agrobacterium tumefaciens]|uniref:SDR family NAD(P)-dependent oxidoreductase n=1 Tax=Agrobacterium tumefaciens TaxID=358 RepID=UPI001572D445|nr:SDR family oxidoreductase [Agrobacterium tumefaciens]NTA84153.1 SDR family oxidoreductase [Agrobacterium tumefaciens]